MELLIQIVLLAVGLVLVVKGADFLVEGATDVARRFNVSEFVIGLTIVGFGTSCPELVVSHRCCQRSVGCCGGQCCRFEYIQYTFDSRHYGCDHACAYIEGKPPV